MNKVTECTLNVTLKKEVKRYLGITHRTDVSQVVLRFW